MSFNFDDGSTRPEVIATTHGADEGQVVRILDYRRAQTLFNKIKANVEVFEIPEDLDAYWQREDLTIDALHLFDPNVSDELTEVYETHRSCLVHGGVARPAQPGNLNAPDSGKKGNDNGFWF